MTNTKSIVETVDRIKVILEAEQENLGIMAVYYGRTEKIPDYPAICVEGGTKRRALSGEGASRKFAIDLAVELYVYFGTIDSAQENTRENELLTERVEDVLHQHFSLDGAVIFGFVTRIEPGVSYRGETMVKVSRITWEARSRQTF
jgi:hypothetical protein